MKKQDFIAQRALRRTSLLLLFLFSGILLLLLTHAGDLFRTQWTPPNISISPPLEIPETEAYGYALRENATDYQMELFDMLIHRHRQFTAEPTEENLLSYAEIISRNFIADFFTLSNKYSRIDVGGIQFIVDETQEEFSRYAMDTMYFGMNQHLQNFNPEHLPTVQTSRIIHSTRSYVYIDALDWTQGTIPTIVVDISWTYASSPLPEIQEFQTSARLTIVETEQGSLRIQRVEEILTPLEPF